MSTPARRRLDFTPMSTSRKRARIAQRPLVLYRGLKPEMKTRVTDLAHTATTYTTQTINPIPQGVDVNERIGGKYKIHRIGGMIRSQGDLSVRLTLYVPKDPSNLLVAGLDTGVDVDDMWVIKDWWLHAGTSPCNRGSFWSHKFPMGVICEMNGTGSGGTDFRKNRILLRIQTPTNDTVSGFSRVWYTDN